MQFRNKYILALLLLLALISNNCKNAEKESKDATENAKKATVDSVKDTANDAVDNVIKEVLPKYEVGDCLFHDNSFGEVTYISETKLVGSDEYVYRLRLEDGTVSKLIQESFLKECDDSL